MKKRITCRIVNSVPTGCEERAIEPRKEQSQYLHEEDQLQAANFWAKQASKTTNVNAFGICMGILNSVPTGQIVDYLA
jgi:hypothetical protein